ncbi:zinc-binding alcohol dehydrogenase family protein [Salsuginibacillus kocurii]|uniref:zinc-binding alcohol dehydrogenase family protein n=1 Tax=Salsuginibacillus kocurii TaxID=427078 RepID=UPI000475CC51|nr:zinc-binding alcohol dehydrogenase family protein [Salsuginibacillus kocurii]
MKAVGVRKGLAIEQQDSLENTELEVPEATGHDLLVNVKAASVNPVDTKVRSGKKDDGELAVLGWDASGVVEATGEKVEMFQPGDEVYYAGDVTRPGSNSEYQLVDERIAAKKPSTLTHTESAALPLTTLTAAEGLFDRLGITSSNAEGKAILIISGAGGVGSMAIPMAKRAGMKVIATASRDETSEWCRQRGADHVINHKRPLQPQLEAEGYDAVPYIFCLSDTEEHWHNLVECIAPQGQICSIVETEGPLPLSDLQHKSATFVWEFMFTRSMYHTSDMINQHHILQQTAELIDHHKLETSLTTTLYGLDAEKLREAHKQLESGSMIGKLVVDFEE